MAGLQMAIALAVRSVALSMIVRQQIFYDSATVVVRFWDSCVQPQVKKSLQVPLLQ